LGKINQGVVFFGPWDLFNTCGALVRASKI
jgi:hypothetical protein